MFICTHPVAGYSDPQPTLQALCNWLADGWDLPYPENINTLQKAQTWLLQNGTPEHNISEG